jgi:hypothetical protein
MTEKNQSYKLIQTEGKVLYYVPLCSKFLLAKLTVTQSCTELEIHYHTHNSQPPGPIHSFIQYSIDPPKWI